MLSFWQKFSILNKIQPWPKTYQLHPLERDWLDGNYTVRFGNLSWLVWLQKWYTQSSHPIGRAKTSVVTIVKQFHKWHQNLIHKHMDIFCSDAIIACTFIFLQERAGLQQSHGIDNHIIHNIWTFL